MILTQTHSTPRQLSVYGDEFVQLRLFLATSVLSDDCLCRQVFVVTSVFVSTRALGDNCFGVKFNFGDSCLWILVVATTWG